MTDIEFLEKVKHLLYQHLDGLTTDRDAANAIILLTTEFLDKCEGEPNSPEQGVGENPRG